MAKLHIGPAFSLPPEAVTETFGVVAKRGAGKTYTILVMVEEMLKAGLVVAVVDPVGVCWGLRASANGRGPGLPILIVGGEHADLPLEPAAGEVMADFLVDHHQSLLLDLSLWRKAPQKRFVKEFAERLFQRNRAPLHVVLDEADMFAPQRPFKGDEPMLGAIEDLVRRGRARGIGVSLVTQRSAVLNKDVLTQCEVLVALRTVAPQDIDAVDAWVKRHATAEQRDRFLKSLPSLPVGTAWFWSPGWLDVFKQVKVRQRDTFDSSATPKVGQKVRPPKRLAPVDIQALKSQIAATIEKAKAEDPRLLRQRVAELEGQLRKVPETKTVEVPVVSPEVVARITQAADRLQATAESVRAQAQAVVEASSGMYRDADIANSAANTLRASLSQARSPVRASRKDPAPTMAEDRKVMGATSALQLRKGERRMLATLGRMASGGIVLNRTQLATLAGFAPKGGTFSSYLGTLKRQGFVSEDAGGLHLTFEGQARSATGPMDLAPLTTPEVLELWRGSLRKGEREMLNALLAAHPRALDRSDLALQTGYEESGGTFSSYIGTLKRNGLVEADSDGSLRAAAILMG